MGYTKRELADQILLKVNGGKPSQDTRVRREDIYKYVPAAVNYAMTKQYYINSQDGYKQLPDDFIATYESVPVQFNAARELYYVQLPARIISLPRNIGLDTISPMKGFTNFVETSFSSRQLDSYSLKHMADQVLYWIEFDKVYFEQLSDLVTELLVRMIASVDDLSPDDQLPIPPGMEVEVLKIVEEFFLEQRKIPADTLDNNNNN